mmetsp:Transcript_63830/g.152242  ORF Transcript_63830/g.152242 Transcript_63830/m.152242 type:complete len:688 (-) Transcript_63830:34-2097(-)|eukprot:CAMPEP_0178423942 /NCGR_PEP_ID=MMETSP0689_2-20121128/27949_1 /TAXON_ID=160604 /ORGANISM="Amphidinium massartii, Strain CS-259" /LENGTH=687 /DNA_ID=CAMNT_0020045553 /DNA_START=67 /DNA_END=2130 /DNA_ORIENTATION=+
MVVFISRFEWEAVKAQQSMRSHTEYLIELCVQFDVPAAAAVASSCPTTPTDNSTPSTATTIEMQDVVLSASWTIRRRYTDFHMCHSQLAALALGSIPNLPPKEPVLQRMVGTSKSRAEWQEVRREALKQYVTELLAHEDLLELLPVQQLLACGPLVRLTRPPQAPASVRARLLASESGPHENEGEEQETKLTKGLEVLVKQAQAPSWQGENLFELAQLPVKEVVVIFREVREEAEGEPGQLRGGEEVAARTYLNITNACEEVGAFVELPAGKAYAIEAYSVSVAGVQSAPVSLVARVPALEEAKVILAAIEAEKSEIASATSGGQLEEAAEEKSVELGNGSNTEDDVPNTSDRSTSKERAEGDAANSEAAPALSKSRASARNEVRKETRGSFAFRGRVAREYVAAASEKNRQLYEKAPHILQHRPSKAVAALSEDAEVVAVKPQMVEVEVVSAESPGDRAEAAEKLHRDAEVLDQERLQSIWSLRLAEAQAAAEWVAKVTGADFTAAEQAEPSQSRRPAAPYEGLQQALSSGEILCELMNQIATRGGGRPVIATYHKKPSTKFKAMENVKFFITACRRDFQLPEAQLFDTIALAEGRDMQAVVKCLTALAARALVVYPEYDGPVFSIGSCGGRNAASSSDLACRDSSRATSGSDLTGLDDSRLTANSDEQATAVAPEVPAAAAAAAC